jgi:hypothetical protein
MCLIFKNEKVILNLDYEDEAIKAINMNNKSMDDARDRVSKSMFWWEICFVVNF